MPEVESPRELDDQILAEARKLAPEKRRFFPASWMPAMAATCAVAVAIVVARPVLQDLDPRVAEEAILPASPRLQLESESVMPGIEDETAAERAIDTQKMRIQQEEQSKQQQSLEVISLPSAKSPDSVSVGTATMSAAIQEIYQDVSSSSTPIYIENQMNEIRRLVSEGKPEEAQALLDSLNVECPDCGLPESIEALE
jgi:hypothetical protein